MARVRVNYKQLERLQRRINKLAQVDLDAFCEAMAKELAARLLREVILRTPVDTGVLRRGWTAGKENVSEKGNVIGVGGKTGFASGLQINKNGNVYEITVYNNIEYSSYLEYGHRTRNHKGWVNGKFMMTISADLIQQKAPAIIERKLKAKLMEVFK
ncbi:hypothetical protein A0U40_13295 [[Bacillus] sp. KCTC 13219]|nr:hypothetical protein A0U40_13295 [[Bacillus] sp. KCTC 13219]